MMNKKKYLMALGIITLVGGTAFASSYITKQNVEQSLKPASAEQVQATPAKAESKNNIQLAQNYNANATPSYTDNMPASMQHRYGVTNAYGNTTTNYTTTNTNPNGTSTATTTLPWQKSNNLKTGADSYSASPNSGAVNTNSNSTVQPWQQPNQQQQGQPQSGNCNDNNIIGTLAGGVIGGLAGNQFGKGKGNTVATIGGAMAGAYAGNQYIPTQNAACDH